MNNWEKLGIAPTSDIQEIKHAFASKSVYVHPDVYLNGFKDLYTAYQEALALAKNFENTLQEPLTETTAIPVQPEEPVQLPYVDESELKPMDLEPAKEESSADALKNIPRQKYESLFVTLQKTLSENVYNEKQWREFFTHPYFNSYKNDLNYTIKSFSQLANIRHTFPVADCYAAAQLQEWLEVWNTQSFYQTYTSTLMHAIQDGGLDGPTAEEKKILLARLTTVTSYRYYSKAEWDSFFAEPSFVHCSKDLDFSTEALELLSKMKHHFPNSYCNTAQQLNRWFAYWKGEPIYSKFTAFMAKETSVSKDRIPDIPEVKSPELPPGLIIAIAVIAFIYFILMLLSL